MKEEIGYTDASFVGIFFFDENDNELMELTGTYNDYAMRVPCIGEHIILSSYEHDYVNDKKAIFKNFYKVIDVISHYFENKGFKNISVQYSVTLKEE